MSRKLVSVRQGTDGRGLPSVFHRAGNDPAIHRIAESIPESLDLPVMLDVPQVMAVLQVSRSWCDHDQILPWVRIGRNKRLHPEDLKGFIQEQRTASIKTLMRRDVGLTPPDDNEPMD